MIGRKLQHTGRAGQLFLPIFKLAVQNFALQRLPLPHREVRVLDREFCQLRRPVLDERTIVFGQLFRSHAQ